MPCNLVKIYGRFEGIDSLRHIPQDSILHSQHCVKTYCQTFTDGGINRYNADDTFHQLLITLNVI